VGLIKKEEFEMCGELFFMLVYYYFLDFEGLD
jgi:hypothetical protein